MALCVTGSFPTLQNICNSLHYRHNRVHVTMLFWNIFEILFCGIYFHEVYIHKHVLPLLINILTQWYCCCQSNQMAETPLKTFIGIIPIQNISLNSICFAYHCHYQPRSINFWMKASPCHHYPTWSYSATIHITHADIFNIKYCKYIYT